MKSYFLICCFGILVLINPCQGQSYDIAKHQDWTNDIDYLDYLIRTRHPNPYYSISKERWNNELQNLKKNVAKLSEKEISIKLSSIVALLNDGHTFLDFDGRYGFDRWFPVRFYDFDDGLFITVTHPAYKQLIGKKVISISGLPASSVLNAVSKAISGDNAFHKRNIAAAFMSNTALLEGMGIIENNQNLILQLIDESGKHSTAEITSISSFYSTNYRNWGELFGPPLEEYNAYVTPFENGKPPLKYREFSDDAPPYYASREPYWFKNYPEYSAFVFQFNFAAEIGPEPFKDFLKRLVAALETTKPEKLIIDVRYNFGGDGSMMVPLVNDIITYSKIHPKTKLYVVQGRQTFSAGIMLAARLKEYLNITLIGEPAGAGYNHYGDPVTYQLPNSKLKLHCSSVFWQLGHPLNDSNVISVEFPVGVNSTDFFQGHDSAFLKIVGSNDLRHISDIYMEEELSIADSIYRSRYNSFGKLKWWSPIDGDSDLMGKKINAILGKQKPESAVRLANIWTEHDAENPLAWMKLSELYHLQKKYDLALEALTKAQNLDGDRLDIKEARAVLQDAPKE
ncbi:hypothetical protein J0X14_10700 [Muricauda sp. CAU 1633]|uniref:S41 family peptidase n=1 Tax=Allomuricauda sp. CAU 1633 TaxID=2816036 RepID=UPI001A8C5D85|nr:S41 family peptidase [Muricauda sp. CAU 1633]MBO0322767.1 hypothetical protein [Muricauda sp. CAU 1633]